MGATHFTGPVFSNGQLLGTTYGISFAGGSPDAKVLYVCSAGGSNGVGDGTDPSTPLATLGGSTGALAALKNRTNKGDIIYVMQGHTESVSSADYFSDTGTAAGFSIVGLGYGSNRPVFNWTTATSTWLLDTAGVELYNLTLNLCGSTATGAFTVATPITVSAQSCRIVSCVINWGQDTDTGCGSTLGAIAVTASNFHFINNRMFNLDTAGTLAVSGLSLNGADYAQIVGNMITGGTTSTTVGAVHFVTTASLNVQIANNYIENRKALSTKALSSAIAGVTGTIEYNRFFVNSGIVAITTTNLPPMFQCFTSNAAAKNGALDVGAGTSA